MAAQPTVEPWWAALTVWAVVNAVNVLQGAGFLSRLRSGSLRVNHALGYVILALGVPAAAALIAFRQQRAGPLHWTGALVFLLFLALMLVVDYLWPIQFRAPARYGVLVPYLVLFFAAILLLGLPMFRLNRSLWLVTVGTTVFLLGAMAAAMAAGVG